MNSIIVLFVGIAVLVEVLGCGRSGVIMTCVLVCLLSAVFITASCQLPDVTTSPEYLCLGDSVLLTCSAQISATWRSDILGPHQSIDFLNGDSINAPVTVGNGTGVLLETSPRIITSLSFNLNTHRVDTRCTDSQLRTTTIISSVQPGPNGDYPVNISGGSIMWDPPSNIHAFLLENYQLTIECDGRDVDDVNTTETTYSYDEGKLIPGLCNVTVRVINSCGDTASNSTSFLMEGPTEVSTEGENNTGLHIALSVGIPALVVIMVIVNNILL